MGADARRRVLRQLLARQAAAYKKLLTIVHRARTHDRGNGAVLQLANDSGLAEHAAVLRTINLYEELVA